MRSSKHGINLSKSKKGDVITMQAFELTRISATNLAQLLATDFCPRCFWLLSRLNFKRPWSIFPRIFNDLDKHQKGFTESYLASTGKLPPWLDQYSVKEVVGVPSYGKFCARHESGVLVTGESDHLFRKTDGDLLLLDYKTSRSANDSMFPIYRGQLSIYAWISLRFGLGKVTDAALVYYEPETEVGDWKLAGNFTPMDGVSLGQLELSGLRLNFRPSVLKMELMDIDEMVFRAKETAELGRMPEPYMRAGYVCTECDRILEFAHDISKLPELPAEATAEATAEADGASIDVLSASEELSRLSRRAEDGDLLRDPSVLPDEDFPSHLY